MLDATPTVHFLCLHNPEHSQMALGFFNQLVDGRAVAWVGSGEPSPQTSPVVITAMAEVGIDISAHVEQPWILVPPHITEVAIATSCDGICSGFMSHRFEEWHLAEPVGHTVAEVRPVRDEIERRVRALITSLGIKVSHSEREPATAEAA